MTSKVCAIWRASGSANAGRAVRVGGGPSPLPLALRSEPEQQPGRILERLLDRDQREHRLAAVDDAVIVGERQVVDRADHDLAVLDDRPVARGVDAEDRALRRVDDRRREHRAEYAAVRDRERAAGQLLDRELAVLGALAEIADLLLDLRERELI